MNSYKKYIAGFVLALMLSLMPYTAFAAGGLKGQKFTSIIYFEHGGKGSQSGLDAGNAKAIADGDVMAIPAGTAVEKVYVIVDVAVTNLNDFDLGDDDDQDGYVVNTSVTLGTPGLYSWNEKLAGAYLFENGTDTAGNTYRHKAVKYYAAAGKEVKLDVGGTSGAGAFRVVVEGYRF